MFNKNKLILCIVSLICLASVAVAVTQPYQSQSAQKKQDYLWGKISATPYQDSELPKKDPNPLVIFRWLTNVDFLLMSFKTASDEMPLNEVLGVNFTRKKLIHTYGTATKVELKITNPGPFTGIFKTGTEFGIARLSLAFQGDPGDPYTPGMALKILVDGKPSLNFQVMYSLDGQGEDKNFFAHSFSNVIPPPSPNNKKLILIAPHFQEAVDKQQPSGPESPTNLPLLQAASLNADGSPVTNPVVPAQIIFTPHKELLEKADLNKDFRVYLKDIPQDEVLYDVYLVLDKKDANTDYDIALTKAQKVGELVKKSEFVASKYEDGGLFFQHANRRQ